MSSHFGCQDSNTISMDLWLVVGRGDPRNWNARPSARITARSPDLKRNERAINLKVELPMALFETPALSATISVDQPLTGVSIDCSAVAEAVKQVIGMDVSIQVTE